MAGLRHDNIPTWSIVIQTVPLRQGTLGFGGGGGPPPPPRGGGRKKRVVNFLNNDLLKQCQEQTIICAKEYDNISSLLILLVFNSIRPFPKIFLNRKLTDLAPTQILVCLNIQKIVKFTVKTTLNVLLAIPKSVLQKKTNQILQSKSNKLQWIVENIQQQNFLLRQPNEEYQQSNQR
jgi:hypothetical protein